MLNAIESILTFFSDAFETRKFCGVLLAKNRYIFGEYLTMFPAVKPNRHSGNATAVLYDKVLPQSIKLRL